MRALRRRRGFALTAGSASPLSASRFAALTASMTPAAKPSGALTSPSERLTALIVS